MSDPKATSSSGEPRQGERKDKVDDVKKWRSILRLIPVIAGITLAPIAIAWQAGWIDSFPAWVALGIAGGISLVAGGVAGYFDETRLTKKVENAEEKAFSGVEIPSISAGGNVYVTVDRSGVRGDRSEAAQGPAVSDLFRLYSSQIELYQTQARGRANWSFFWALIAMSAGLGVVGVAAWYILQAKEWPAVAAGSVIATVGGSMSAFLAKTFLEIHRASLDQLAAYFRQPVVNDHVVMAERIASYLPAGDERNAAYRDIVSTLLTRIYPESVKIPTPSLKAEKALRKTNGKPIARTTVSSNATVDGTG